MASHSVRRQLKLTPRGDGGFDADVELMCGCELSLTVAAERTVLLATGERRVAGKYPCPRQHPVARGKVS